MKRRSIGLSLASVVASLLAGCGDDNNRLLDAGADDLGAVDTPAPDLGTVDVSATDRGAPDAGAADTGSDVAVDRAVALDVTRDATTGDATTGDATTGDATTGDAPDVPRADVVAVDASDAAFADGAADGGSARGTPVIDGVIGSDWPAGAIVARNTVPSAWGPTLNALRSVRVAWDANRLYLGLDGVVEATNAMMVFIDRDYLPGTTATGVTAISTLTDGIGALDNSISCNVTEAPLGFGTDMVWGTRGMLSQASTDINASIGLRDVGCPTCRNDFRWTMGAGAVCVGGAAPACEVAIEWSALYGGARPPVPMLGLFVRITNADGDSLANNQCLPEQGASDPPTAARRVLAFSPDL